MALLNLFHHVSASVIQVVCRILPVYLMAVAVVLCLYSFWATIQAYYLSGLNVFPAVKVCSVSIHVPQDLSLTM